jgi:type I restriction enzyme M protein
LPAEEILGPRAYEYFTPGILAKFMIDLLQPKKGATFLDPACGFGSLLVEAASRGAIVTGFDINSDIVQYAEVNLALAGLSGKILAEDSLRLPEGSAQDIHIHAEKICFDYAAVVPPFGGRIEDERLNSFDLGLKKKGQTTEVLFFESTLKLLREGGKMAIVLPDGFLFADSAYDAREFMLRKSKIIAIISLPNRVLSPNLAFNSSLLVLQSSPSTGTTKQDPVFVAIVEDVKLFDSIVHQFRAFQLREAVPTEKDVFTTHLTSAKQINADYLRASLSMEMIDSKLAATKGSENVELEEIADLTTGVRLEEIGQEDQKGDVFYIRGGNVGDLSLEVNDNDRVRTKADISRWSAQPGDILMTRAGTVGRVAMAKGDFLPIIISSNIIRIRISDKNRVLPEYLLAYLGSEHGQTRISMYTGGSVIRAASISGLKRLRIPIPSMKRQLEVAAQVGRLLEAKRDAREVLSKLKMKEDKIRKELEKLVLEVEK